MNLSPEVDQAIRLLRSLHLDNERLRLQVASLQLQLDLARTAGGPLSSETAKAWTAAMAAANPEGFKSLYVGDDRWDEFKGLATGLGLRALLLDLTAISGDDRMQRNLWDIRWRKAPGKAAADHFGKYPPRFRNQLSVATVLRQRGQDALAATLEQLTKGLRGGTKAYLVVQVAFLLFEGGAVQALSHEPAAVLDRILKEQRRVNDLVSPFGAFKDLFQQALGSDAAEAQARKTLGVTEGADRAAIKAAYRALAKETHPDAPGGDREAFEKVQSAFELLTA